MRLSNKSAFCLASLILLLVLGCVYATIPVYAHAPGSLDTSNNPITSHTHLNVTTPTEDAPNTEGVAGNVPAYNHHPTVTSIVLKETLKKVRDDMVVVAADDNDAANGAKNSLP